jgi:hypothetical protein
MIRITPRTIIVFLSGIEHEVPSASCGETGITVSPPGDSRNSERQTSSLVDDETRHDSVSWFDRAHV